MRKLKYLAVIFIFILSACTREDDIDTPPVVYYDGNVLVDDTIITIDFGDMNNDLRSLFSVTDDNDMISYSDINMDLIDTSVLGDTTYTLSISDSSDNVTTHSVIIRVIDSLYPTISMTQTSFEEGVTWADVIDFVVTSDNDSVSVIDYQYSSPTLDDDGDYELTVVAIDPAGNETSKRFDITITKRPFYPVQPEDDQDDGIIYFILESSIPGYYDYHIAAKAIQGIVNRNQPNLMIVDLNNPFYTYTDTVWKDYIESEEYTFIELTSFLEVLTTFEYYFSDIIAINDDYKSYNGWVSSDADFGAMITSVTTYMPVPEGYLTTAEQHLDIELIESFTLNDVLLSGYISDNFDFYEVSNAQEGYGFLFDNFKELFATDKFMGLTSEAMDYAVQQQMMFFDLKPTYQDYDNELYTRICEYFDEQGDLFRLYGWVDQEGSGLNFIGKYGGLMNPVGTQNLSLYHVIPVDVTFTQKSTFVSSYDPTKKYVTFLASEGDTFKAPMTFQQGSWLDPYRGEVPINWGLIGITVEEFPIIAKYMYDTMTSNDYFFSGGSSSIGYVDVDTQMPEGAVLELINWNKQILLLSDQKYVDTYNDLFMFGDTFSPTFTGDYLIASGYTGAYGINPWESTGPIYMSDMLFYNRRNVFYPRRGYSSYVSLSNMTRESSARYVQDTISDYWYLQTNLTRTTSDAATIEFFTQANGDGYVLTVDSGLITLSKIVGGTTLEIGSVVASTIGSHELIISVDKSSSMLDSTVITVYLDKERIFHENDLSFFEGGFTFTSDAGVTSVFRNVVGQHKSQSEEIFDKIIQDPNDFIVGYYGVVFDHDFTLSQYHTEPGPGEVVSLSPTDFYRIQLLLEEMYPGEYVIVNMDEFYTYLELSETN